MEHKLYISLGSNQGNRKALIDEALRLIGLSVGRVERVSSMYETEPWGFNSVHKFLNAAALVLTTLSPMECLTEAQRIERKLGRRKKSKDGKYHDRPIDIDLLLYDDWEINTPELTIPHPLMEQRDFVKLPLAEIRTEELKSSPTT